MAVLEPGYLLHLSNFKAVPKHANSCDFYWSLVNSDEEKAVMYLKLTVRYNGNAVIDSCAVTELSYACAG